MTVKILKKVPVMRGGEAVVLEPGAIESGLPAADEASLIRGGDAEQVTEAAKLAAKPEQKSSDPAPQNKARKGRQDK